MLIHLVEHGTSAKVTELGTSALSASGITTGALIKAATVFTDATNAIAQKRYC